MREKLAALAHESWSGWMQYLFNRTQRSSRLAPGHECVISHEDAKRWQRQMNTPYADLPESEKASDRAEADKMLAVLQAECLHANHENTTIQSLGGRYSSEWCEDCGAKRVSTDKGITWSAWKLPRLRQPPTLLELGSQ